MHQSVFVSPLRVSSQLECRVKKKKVSKVRVLKLTWHVKTRHVITREIEWRDSAGGCRWLWRLRHAGVIGDEAAIGGGDQCGPTWLLLKQNAVCGSAWKAFERLSVNRKWWDRIEWLVVVAASERATAPCRHRRRHRRHRHRCPYRCRCPCRCPYRCPCRLHRCRYPKLSGVCSRMNPS